MTGYKEYKRDPLNKVDKNPKDNRETKIRKTMVLKAEDEERQVKDWKKRIKVSPCFQKWRQWIGSVLVEVTDMWDG